MAREHTLRVKQQQEQNAINARKPLAHAIKTRDAVRDLAVMNSVNEVELHRMADRIDAIAKQMGLAALTLKAAGISPAAASREADLSDAIAITKAAAVVEPIMPHQATEDCQHAGCIYLATHGKYCTLHQHDDITVISDDDLPAEFRADAIYANANDEEFAAKSDAFKLWCAKNGVFYYARSKENFFKWQAFELCAAAGCTKLLMEDLS